jgi:hypothetical protein
MTLFLHFINQSYNTACNYSNRAGNEMSDMEIAKAYGLAVASACSMAFGLGKVIQKGPAFLKSFGIFIPIVATAAASSSNLALTRSSEMTNGVSLTDETGKVTTTIIPLYCHIIHIHIYVT